MSTKFVAIISTRKLAMNKVSFHGQTGMSSCVLTLIHSKVTL